MLRFKNYITEIADVRHDILHPPQDHLMPHEKIVFGTPDHFALAHNTLARYYHNLNVLGPQSMKMHTEARRKGLVLAPEGYIKPAVFHPETGEQVSAEKLVHPKLGMLPDPMELGINTAEAAKRYHGHMRNAALQVNQHILHVTDPRLPLPPRVRLHHAMALGSMSDTIKELITAHKVSIAQGLKQPHILAGPIPESPHDPIEVTPVTVQQLNRIHRALREGFMNPTHYMPQDARFEVSIGDQTHTHTIDSVPEHHIDTILGSLRDSANEHIQRINDEIADEREKNKPKD